MRPVGPPGAGEGPPRLDDGRALVGGAFRAANVTPTSFGLVDPSLVSPELGGLPPRPLPLSPVHLAARLGVEVEAIAELSTNANPLGASEGAREAAARALERSHHYPSADPRELRVAIAARHGVTDDQIVVGNGSSELIELLVRTFVGPGQTVVCPWPSFGAYRVAAQVAGRELLAAPLRRGRIDLGAVAALVDPRTKLVFLANPNNPTGTYVGLRELAAFLHRVPPETLVVIDEAYADFVDAPDYPRAVAELLPGHPRLVVLRTFSKAHGLAGLRVGYGVMAPALAAQLERAQPVFAVNAVGAAAALAALEDPEHVERSRRFVVRERGRLAEGLRRLDLTPLPSQANFVCVRGLPVGAAAALEAHGILVRDMSSYSVPDAVRITVGSPEANTRVLTALEAVLDRGEGRR